MDSISVFIPVRPEHKARPRFGIRHIKGGKSFVSVHTPSATRTAEAAIRAFMQGHLLSQGFKAPWDGPVKIRVMFRVERPKSVKKRIYPVSKPDVDNYAKLLCDSLNGLLWVDDSQIVLLYCGKCYADEQSPVGIAFEAQQLSTADQNGQTKCTINKGRRSKNGC